MDSALYTYQQNVTVNDNGYHISYSMLMQKNGDYVILEERLRPETPVFFGGPLYQQKHGASVKCPRPCNLVNGIC